MGDTTDHPNLNQLTTIGNNEINQCQQRQMTYEQIKAILEQHPCIGFENESENNSNRRMKRWGDTSNKINAIHGTINEHRTMINYLINNTVNATFVTDAIGDHHSNTRPQFTSWRDIVDLICITIFIGYILYFLICRTGLGPCNHCLSFLSKHMVPRVQQQKQQEQQLQEQIKKELQEQFKNTEQIKMHSFRQKKGIYPSTPSVVSDVFPTNKGYIYFSIITLLTPMSWLQQEILKIKHRNNQFRVLPSFTPLNKYTCYLIHRSTPQDLLHDLICLAQKCKLFTINTEFDLYDNNNNNHDHHRPALIQIEFIDEYLSTVILIEVCHLPSNRTSLMFWLIRSIFKFIFQETKTIYVWGNHIDRLSPFIDYDLFTMDDLMKLHCINIQDIFKNWHSRKFGYTQPNANLWALQLAIVNTYHEFFDKSQTINRWSRTLVRYNHNQINSKISAMINYACYQCLAITKLAYTIHQLTFNNNSFF
ncbi:unnamed protein product [Rotaria socialis]|uniref:Uncharacterized protein n=1 Tax=Rotaria socialis TaxID=392032 RepID=A0A818JI24_9BILA|nr:unnamed protein product [Rotaria socialis]CAF3539878.1 unnamed protein product [Rotaria socialis]CAF4396608.1 unnamed protein product [Rotaria socialis]CAF4674553.1 unnamed protein product [Rotaria socialis]